MYALVWLAVPMPCLPVSVWGITRPLAAGLGSRRPVGHRSQAAKHPGDESRIPKERTKHAPLVVASGHPRVWTLAGPAVSVCGLLQTLLYACSIKPHVHRGNSTLECHLA